MDDPADIAAVTPGGAALLFPDFMVNQVVGADAYRLEIATTEAFDTPTVLHSADTYSANELKAAAELDAESTYYWRAAAQKGGSWGPWTAARSFTLVDLAHVSPAAGATTPDPLPELSWEPVSGATGYQLQLADSEGAVTSAPIVDVGSPEYAVPSALANDQYHYWRFRATTAGGRATGWSTTRSFFVAAVGAVSNLGAAVGDAEVELTWNDPADSDLAEIRVTQDPDGGIAQVVSPGTEQLTLTGLTNGTTYTFTLVASNTAGDISGEVTVTATPTDVRGTVTGLSAAPAAAEVQLTWSDPSYLGLDSIEISWTPDGTSPVSLTPGTETYTATGLLNGSEYTFTVTAFYADGSSSAAETVTVRTGLPDTIAWSGVNPADGGSTVDTTPTLAWDDVFGAARYELQIAETEADLPAATVQNVTVSQYTPGSFLSNWSTYYWRLRALDAEDNSTNWSSVFSFTVSWGELSGLTPADAATGTDTTPTFGWDAVTGADSYEVQIADTQSALSSAPPATTSDASYTPTAPLTNNQTHYWRVRARDADGQFGPWSAARSISVAWGAVSGLSPADGTTANDTTPTFSWDSAEGATGYELQLAESATGVESAPAESLAVNSFTPSAALTNYTGYYWRVRAVDADGQYGSWSQTQSLDIAWGDISGLLPSNGSVAADTSPTFTWNTVSGAVGYEVQIADSQTGVESAPTQEVATNSYTPTTGLTNNQTHYWRVRAVDANGRFGAWSQTQSLDIAWGDIFGLLPSNGSTAADTSPTFTWDAVSGAVGYEVQIADSQTGVESAPTQEVATNSYTPTTGLTNNQTHYWRVRAVDANGQFGAWTTTSAISIVWGVITGQKPLDGETVPHPMPTLEWTDVEGAVEYEVQIADTVAGVAATTAVTVTESNYTYPTELTDGDSLYWRVRPRDASDQYGTWSDVAGLTKRPYEVGDVGPAGGTVFYDKGSYSSGWRYLEAAPSDQHSAIRWGGRGTAVGGTSTAIGAGEANTATIVASLGDNAGTPYAAKLCYDLELGGYDDWFLPSKDELNVMYNRKEMIGFQPFTGTFLGTYWSSSESSAAGFEPFYAWLQHLESGLQREDSKSIGLRVRAIRTF